MKTRAAVLRHAPIRRPYSTTRPLSVETVDLDPPGPDEQLVRIGTAGLCHSDLSVINGDRHGPCPWRSAMRRQAQFDEINEAFDLLDQGTVIRHVVTF